MYANLAVLIVISLSSSGKRFALRLPGSRSAPGAVQPFDCLPRLARLLRGLQIDRDQLGDAAPRHGDAEQPVHPRHGDRVVGDDHEPGVGEPDHLVEQVADALDVDVFDGASTSSSTQIGAAALADLHITIAISLNLRTGCILTK